MARNLYKILKINYNTLDAYGKVFIVYANKASFVNEELGMASFSHTEGDDTELFVYPQEMSVIKPIDNIGKSGKPWEPNMDEYRDGGVHFQEGRRIAHFHNSLISITKRVEMIYRPMEVSFDQLSWHKLGEGEEWGEKWEFSTAAIDTPYGVFDIEGFMEVEQNGMRGIQIDVDGTLWLSELPGSPGDTEVVLIRTIAIVRQPYNVWLWVHLFDEDNSHVASFSGTEQDIMANEFSKYVEKLRTV